MTHKHNSQAERLGSFLSLKTVLFAVGGSVCLLSLCIMCCVMCRKSLAVDEAMFNDSADRDEARMKCQNNNNENLFTRKKEDTNLSSSRAQFSTEDFHLTSSWMKTRVVDKQYCF